MTHPGARYEALIQLLRTAENLWNSSRAFFTRWDLSPSQFNILNLLRDQPGGCTQIELSRGLIMHRSNVTGLVDRLEARGLVQRREDPRDRRVYRVVLTVDGARLLEDILPQYYRAAEEAWGKLPLKRIKELVRHLEQVSANADAIAQKTASGGNLSRSSNS